MAGHRLIAEYLDELREHVSTWHRHPDDVVAEAADHLAERTAALTAAGDDEDDAVRRSIREYGDARELANHHLRCAKRPAIATNFTRSAGQIAMAGGAMWIALVAAAAVLSRTELTLAYAAMATILHIAATMGAIAVVGLWKRHGGFGFLTVAAAIPAAMSAPFVMFAWPILAWLVLLGLSTLIVGIALFVGGLLPRPWVTAFTFGLSGPAAAAVAAEMTATRHGEDFAFLASTWSTASVMAGIVVFGVGLMGIGRWLHAETPVEVPTRLPTPIAR